VRGANGVAILNGRITATPWQLFVWGAGLVVLVVLLLAPLLVSDFTLSVILTRSLWLGIAAASVVFLAAYGGMVSLGQVGLYGIAGFTMANLVASRGGMDHVAINPWLAVVIAIVVTVAVGLAFGAIAARTEGIYFLMITLAFGVIVFYFFAQVTQLSGFGGINNVSRPAIVGNPVTQPMPLFYISLVCAVAIFFGIKYLLRTPFGITLQGIRDEPERMRALGYNVFLHRTLAFGVGALIAAIAGILSVWYNTRISPGSVGLGQIISVLVIAVIGGLYRIEGAFVGALVYTLINNYSRTMTPSVGAWLGPDRFNTLIGLIFLAIVLASPGGLVGIWTDLKGRAERLLGARQTPTGPAAAGTPGPSTERRE
jgi:branched-chain amino acid transport system permease protein